MLGDELVKTAELLRPILEREVPQSIYLPHPLECHPDHKAALPIVRAALDGCAGAAPALRCYEVWTPLAQYDHVEDITTVMTRKLRALRAHRSQLAEFDYVRAVRGLNVYRGALAGKCRYAEVFQTVAIKAGT